MTLVRRVYEAVSISATLHMGDIAYPRWERTYRHVDKISAGTVRELNGLHALLLET